MRKVFLMSLFMVLVLTAVAWCNDGLSPTNDFDGALIKLALELIVVPVLAWVITRWVLTKISRENLKKIAYATREALSYIIVTYDQDWMKYLNVVVEGLMTELKLDEKTVVKKITDSLKENHPERYKELENVHRADPKFPLVKLFK